MSNFPSFGKIPRLNRDIVITEKIDGTNALVAVEDIYPGRDVNWTDPYVSRGEDHVVVVLGEAAYMIRPGSRNRWLTPENDNHGFARWVFDNAVELAKLGPGNHYGEWWGKGIQRGYGLDERRFSLFNVKRWSDDSVRPKCAYVVPVLYRGGFLNFFEEDFLVGIPFFNVLSDLLDEGSVAAPGFKNPEGIIIYHEAANQLFKYLLENDSQSKGMQS